MADVRRTKVSAKAMVALLLVGAAIGVWRLAARRSGGAAADRIAGARATRFAPDLDVDPAQATAGVAGTVRDAAGKPVAGAIVTLTRARARDSVVFSMPRAAAVTATAGDGRYHFDQLTPGDYGVTAIATGWAPAQKAPVTVRASAVTRADLALGKDGVTLSGRVLDIGGGVIAGARVLVAEYTATAINMPRLYQATAGSDGTYRVALARGSFGLTVESEGYATARATVYLSRDDVRDVTLMPAARIAGRVVERKTGEPVADADVWVMADRLGGFSYPRDVKSDQNGAFVFNDLDPGAYAVAARHGKLVGTSRLVAVKAAQTAGDVVVEMDPGHAVSGRVVASSGKPLEGARVFLQRSDPPFERGLTGKSAADGTFVLEGATSGKHRLGAGFDGHASTERPLVVDGEVKGVELKLPEAIVVAGVVLSADGKPVEGAQVQARVQRDRSEDRMGPGSFDRTVSDAEGRFELLRLAAGKISLEAQHREQGRAKAGPDDVAFGQKREYTLRLARGATISGVVRFDDKTPAAGVRVMGFPRTNGPIFNAPTETTGPEGQFTIGPFDEGAVELSASRKSTDAVMAGPAASRATVALAAGEQKTGVELVVAKGGNAIAGRVVDPDGKPLAGATVTWGPERDGRAFRGGGRDNERVLTGDDGAFLAEDLSAGSYTVWAFHPGFADGENKGVTAPATGVKVTLAAESALAGVVVTPDGKPIGDYTMLALPGAPANETVEQKRARVNMSSGYDSPTLRIHDPAGGFEITRLKPGAYELRATTGGQQVGSLPVAVGMGEKKTGLRLVISAGVRLKGRVVEADAGTPLENVLLRAQSGGRSIEGRTDSTGKFELAGFAPGETAQFDLRPSLEEPIIPEYAEVDVPATGDVVDAGTFRLMRAPDWMDRFRDRGTQGFASIQRGGHVIVTQVWPRVASLLKVGDVITAVEGRDVRTLGPGAVRYLLARKPGANATFTVESPEGAARTVTIEAAKQ